MKAAVKITEKVIVEKIPSIYLLETLNNPKHKDTEMQGMLAGKLTYGIAVDTLTSKEERLIGGYSIFNFIKAFAPAKDPTKWWNTRRIHVAYRLGDSFEEVTKLESAFFELDRGDLPSTSHTDYINMLLTNSRIWLWSVLDPTEYQYVNLILRTNSINLSKITIE